MKGFSVIEVILAAAIFLVFASGIGTVVLVGFGGNRLGEEQTIATQFASEGIEAAKSIKNQAYSNLINSAGTGLAVSGGVWTFSGSNNQYGPSNKYTRVITVGDVQRDGSGNIVASGGSADNNTKKITSTVSWNVTPTRADSVVLTSYLTNFRKPVEKSGMLVYGNGGTTTDAVQYQTIDSSGTWSTPASTADVDGGSTNRALRAATLEASATRNEKILISRHFDGTTQYIYAQVYNGSTWGNVQLLSSWNANTFLDVRNFDGTYLNDGTFMAVYSDNTNVPKMRTWNGTSWSGQSSLTSLGAATEIPSFIRIAARPGTNEAMAVFFTQVLDSISQYWSGSAWSAITSHATNGFNANNQEADFAWNTNTPTTGAIIYITAGGDKTPRTKIFQANGSGGGTWGAQANGANIAQAVRSMMIVSRSTANEFESCYKDQQAAPDITCRKITFSGTTATWTTPTNPIITSTSVSSTNLSFGFGVEPASDNQAVIVYSDNTNAPKLKKYNVATSTWDSAATTISTTPFTLGSPVQSTRVIPLGSSDDLMTLIADTNLDLYSVMWDGTNNQVYTTPAGKAFTQHGTNGSASTDFWYDFVWDQ